MESGQDKQFITFSYQITNVGLGKCQKSKKHLGRKRDQNVAKGEPRNLDTAHECLCVLCLQATHPGEFPLEEAQCLDFGHPVRHPVPMES